MREHLRMVVAFHLPFYAPVWVAQRIGAFQDEDLDITFSIPTPGHAPDALQQGDADIAFGGVMRSYVQADRGMPDPHLAIAEINSRDGFFLVSRQPVPDFTWRHLAGKRLALFALAPTPWMCLQGVLREHGVDPATVTAVPDLGVAEGMAALQSGEVDFLQTALPMALELADAGRGYLAAAQAPDVGHVPYSSLIVTPAFRRERPDLCAKSVRAVTRALRWMAGQTAEAIAGLVVSEFAEFRPEHVRSAVATLHAAGAWAEGPHQDRAAYERLGRFLVAGGLIRTAAPYEALVDDSFAVAAAAGGVSA